MSEGVAVAGRIGNVRHVEEAAGGAEDERVPLQSDQPARVYARREAQVQGNWTLRLQVNCGFVCFLFSFFLSFFLSFLGVLNVLEELKGLRGEEKW